MKKIIGWIKMSWLFFWAGMMSILLFFPIYITALFSKTGNLPFTLSKIWAHVMLLASFTRVRVVGKENIEKNRSYVIISNHQSNYDIVSIVTGLGIQFRWVIKKELLKVPLFGYALYKSRNIFVDRSNTERAKESITNAINRLPDGVSVMVFAEGTRSKDGKLRDFKKGGFVIASEKGFPILPVTVNGSRKIMPKGSLVFKPGTVTLVVGKPIKSEIASNGKAIDALMAETKKTIEASLELD